MFLLFLIIWFVFSVFSFGRFLLFDDILLLRYSLFALLLLVVRECLVADYWYVIEKYYPTQALRKDCLRGLRNWFSIMFCEDLGPFWTFSMSYAKFRIFQCFLHFVWAFPQPSWWRGKACDWFWLWGKTQCNNREICVT